MCFLPPKQPDCPTSTIPYTYAHTPLQRNRAAWTTDLQPLGLLWVNSNLPTKAQGTPWAAGVLRGTDSSSTHVAALFKLWCFFLTLLLPSFFLFFLTANHTCLGCPSMEAPFQFFTFPFPSPSLHVSLQTPPGTLSLSLSLPSTVPPSTCLSPLCFYGSAPASFPIRHPLPALLITT